jgi:hypothetical protein
MIMKKGDSMSSVNWVATDAKETKEIPVVREPFTRSLEDGVDTVVSLIEENYITWSGLKMIDYGPEWEKSEVIKERMAYEFVKGVDYKKGSKYIKIITGGSVWGFIVNTKTDNKFNYGDILKAAGWAAPARNFARGNVIKDSVEDLRKNSVSWTGVRY